MWKNFGACIGLLTIAMIAALYSSSAGREGRGIPASISAIIALIIAVWVGVRLLPRLASSVDWDWLPFLSRYHITRDGWMCFGAVAVVVFAAVNTSNNLLYMVLSALLAVLVLSGFLSSLNFRHLRIDIRVPSHCFAAEPFSASVLVHNEKKVFPSLSIQFETQEHNAFRFSNFYIPLIRAERHVSQIGQARFTKRGRYVMREMRASSRYPFGFFLKYRKYAVAAECICYPEIIPVERMNRSALDIQGSNARFERGPGFDLYTIRDYLPVDSARHVHWKASAKTAVLKTREYAAEESRRIILAFDRFGQSGDAEKFEQLVSYTASIAYHLIQDEIEVSLVSDDWKTGYGNSEMLLVSILEYLALVNMSASASRPAVEPGDGVHVLSLRG